MRPGAVYAFAVDKKRTLQVSSLSSDNLIKKFEQALYGPRNRKCSDREGLQQDCFSNEFCSKTKAPRPKDTAQKRVGSATATVFAVSEADGPVAMLQAAQTRGIGGLYLYNICVASAYRGKGLFWRLLAAVESLFPSSRLTLTVYSPFTNRGAGAAIAQERAPGLQEMYALAGFVFQERQGEYLLMERDAHVTTERHRPREKLVRLPFLPQKRLRYN